MPLYSITRFRNTGSTTQNETPYATNDWRASMPPEAKYDAEKLDALQPGQSSVLAIRTGEKAYLIIEGIRITRLPDFKMNEVLFDGQAKEYVKVTNGHCVLDHSSTEGFHASHKGYVDCMFAPSEAVALRPFIGEDGQVSVAWTYRGVDACHLQEVSSPEGVEKQFERVFNGKRKEGFIGRI